MDRAAIAVALPALAICAIPCTAEPQFADLALDRAVAAAQAADKLLLVSVIDTASPQSKSAADQVLWQDAGCADWIAAHAIAIELDLNDNADFARDWKIERTPAIGAFRDGQFCGVLDGGPLLFDRALLTWMGAISRASLHPAEPDDRAAPAKDGPGMDERRAAAARLVEQGDYADATTALLALWRARATIPGVSVSRTIALLANDLGRFGRMYAPAGARFTRERDGLQPPPPPAQPSDGDLDAWLALNAALRDEGATLAWIDAQKPHPAGVDRLRKREALVKPLLVRHERWEDLSALKMDEIAELERCAAGDPGHFDHFETILRDAICPLAATPQDEAMWEEVLATARIVSIQENARLLYRDLLVARRDDAAAMLAARARELDPSPTMLCFLASAGEASGRPTAEHLAWATEGSEAGVKMADRLVERLRRALAE